MGHLDGIVARDVIENTIVVKGVSQLLNVVEVPPPISISVGLSASLGHIERGFAVGFIAKRCFHMA